MRTRCGASLVQVVGETGQGRLGMVGTPQGKASRRPVQTRATRHDAGSHVPTLRFLATLLLVSAGESCVYPGTSAEFSVDAAGSGHFLFVTAGSAISLQDTTVNGVRYDFAASKQADGTWLITVVGS